MSIVISTDVIPLSVVVSFKALNVQRAMGKASTCSQLNWADNGNCSRSIASVKTSKENIGYCFLSIPTVQPNCILSFRTKNIVSKNLKVNLGKK